MSPRARGRGYSALWLAARVQARGHAAKQRVGARLDLEDEVVVVDAPRRSAEVKVVLRAVVVDLARPGRAPLHVARVRADVQHHELDLPRGEAQVLMAVAGLRPGLQEAPPAAGEAAHRRSASRRAVAVRPAAPGAVVRPVALHGLRRGNRVVAGALRHSVRVQAAAGGPVGPAVDRGRRRPLEAEGLGADRAGGAQGAGVAAGFEVIEVRLRLVDDLLLLLLVHCL
mmetsp:Transcript_70950/g.182947  ORF Transcript_70950/g.182947 Transcript_70950/m.182947 type:complete len:227 (-) Transcript_70950:326-1006(-)